MKKRSFLCLLLAVIISLFPFTESFALRSTTMTVGSKGTEVRKLQQALIDLGFLKDKADGVFGPKTEAAVRSFQASQGLTVDGLAGTGTKSRLYSSDSFSPVATPAPQGTPVPTTAPAPAARSAGDSLFGGNYATLRQGNTGSRVILLQTCLIKLNYLEGKADGKFGPKTEKAVRDFQKAYKLTTDGLAGKKTLTRLEQMVSGSAEPAATPAPTVTPAPTPVPAQQASSSAATPVIQNGKYLCKGDKGEQVTLLQTRLNELHYDVKVTGSFDESTRQAVVAFQQRNKLSADGVAGYNTLTKLYSANPVTGDTELPTLAANLGKITPPAASQVKLLHWFNDIKPSLKNGQVLLVYDPSSGLAWSLKLLSLGRHADAEPLTQQDTDIMFAAFGNQNTWNQKAVWVRLPSGTWVLGSTHDMPHLSGNIKDNGFNGHLCVHFLRDMAEAEKNDPDYGVANQKTIRKAWKNLTGEELTY